MNYKKKKERNYRKHKHMAAKQYAMKQPTDHWRNQRLRKNKKKKKKHLEVNENESTTIQNLRDVGKAVIFIFILIEG